MGYAAGETPDTLPLSNSPATRLPHTERSDHGHKHADGRLRPAGHRRQHNHHRLVDPSCPGGLVVTGVTKSFGPQPVLHGVDLVVAEHSFTAILGPSGSGKTTLLRLIAGFDRPDGGRITLGGRLVDAPHEHVASQHRRIGYVPQEGALFPHLTVAANIGFGLGRRQRGTVVADLVDMVGLGDLTRRYPHQLSGGQQQRVALARALAIRPDLVLLDEPFSSLDASMRASVRTEVRRVLAEAGTTALLVTHDQDEALSLADEVAVLRAGLIVQQGTPAELYARPADPALAQFVGEGNLVTGVVRDGRIVTTLGALDLVEEARAMLVEGQQALAVIRPEQLRLRPGPGRGLSAQVDRADFHGHDTVIVVSATSAGQPPTQLAARLAAALPMEPGTAVTVTATGPVMAWPG